jgi:ABC-2 type transport system permease protein
VNATVVRLTARSLLGRRRALLLLALPAVLLLLAVLFRTLGGVDDRTTVDLLGGLAVGTLVPLLALIAGTGAIGPEIDDGSIVYLLAKPVRRSTVATSKTVVAAAVVTVFGAVPVVLAGVVLSGTSSRLALAYGLGALVAGITYAALFLLLAVVTRHAVILGLLYAIVWESLVGTFVPGAQKLSIQQWSLSLTKHVVGTDVAARLSITAAVGLGVAVPLLLVVALGSTWFAGWRLRSLSLTGED